MRKLSRLIFSLMALVTIMAALAGCAPQPAADNVTVKSALLPILEAMPFYVAKEAGLFETAGVKVEFVAASSAAERDQIMAAGQADGMVNDLLATALFNRQSAQVQVVRFAQVATATQPNFRLVASPQSGIKSVKDLAGVEIGISQASIIDYITYRMLTGEGLKPDQIKTLAVPKIPDRMALLQSGQLKAATLPEPFSTLAVSQGAVVIIDDTKYTTDGTSVLTFRKKFLDEHPVAVKNLVTALNQAIETIQKNPQAWRKIFEQYKLVPANLAASYPIPSFPAPSVPTQQQWDDVVNWALGRALIDKKVSYTDSVTDKFIK